MCNYIHLQAFYDCYVSTYVIEIGFALNMSSLGACSCVCLLCIKEEQKWLNWLMTWWTRLLRMPTVFTSSDLVKMTEAMAMLLWLSNVSFFQRTVPAIDWKKLCFLLLLMFFLLLPFLLIGAMILFCLRSPLRERLLFSWVVDRPPLKQKLARCHSGQTDRSSVLLLFSALSYRHNLWRSRVFFLLHDLFWHAVVILLHCELIMLFIVFALLCSCSVWRSRVFLSSAWFVLKCCCDITLS